MKKFCVYEHVFPNGKRYIGITSKKPNARWQNGAGYSEEHQPVMYNAIAKYGWENIEHNILFENLTEEDAKQKEIELIKKYHTFIHDNNSMGYNMTRGGDGNVGRIMSEENKQKLRERLLGKRGSECCNSYAVICDDIEYGSITEFCELNNLPRGRVECWLNGKHKMPKEWLDKNLRVKDKEDKRQLEPQVEKRNNFIYDGIIFYSQKSLAEYLGCSTASLCYWLTGKKNPPKSICEKDIYYIDGEKIIFTEQKQPVKTKVIYDGVIYDSQKELAKILNIKPATINAWLRGKNKMPLEHKNKGLNYYT